MSLELADLPSSLASPQHTFHPQLDSNSSQWPVPRSVSSSFPLPSILTSLFTANRPQIDRRFVVVVVPPVLRPILTHITTFTGKAPRKQLATKAARKTAQVTLPTLSLSLSSPSPLLSSSLSLLCHHYVHDHTYSLSSPNRLQPVVSRSPIVSVPEPLLSVKSGATRSQPSSLSGSSPSSVSSVKLLRTSRSVIVFHQSLLT